MLNVSAIRIKSRSWLRPSSIHEPSDPPLTMNAVSLLLFHFTHKVSLETESTKCHIHSRAIVDDEHKFKSGKILSRHAT